MFNFSIKYNRPTSDGVALFNGNISQTSWNSLSESTAGSTALNEYSYAYDALNRLTAATGTETSNYNVSGISYDKNGNILNLIRKGHTDANATAFGTMDNLVYSYDAGNKLKKVADRGNDTYGFKDGVNTDTEYFYDDNGNMIADLNKGIEGIVYNHLNLPTEVIMSGNNTIKYVYDAAGVKLSKTVKYANRRAPESPTSYAGNFIYENNALQFFNHPEGYVKANVTSSGVEMGYVYQYKDHLGNVRLSYTDNDKNGVIDADTEIIEESNYYPFGLKHKGYNNVVNSLGNATAQRKNYNGKEFQDELGLNWLDYGWRNYDPSLGRFMNLDPLAEFYHTDTPYTYVLNNPLSYIDPDGREVIGVTRNDADILHVSFNNVFSGKKFDKLRSLFTRGKKNNKKKFDKIGKEALKDALSGLEGDDLALAEIVTGAINSEAEHKVEFVKDDETASSEGSKLFIRDFNSEGEKIKKGSKISANAIDLLAGGGFNAASKKGSHSVILQDPSHHENFDVTNFHEIFGHGIPNAKKGVSRSSNNANAIRTDNLVRRVLGIKAQRDGSDHNGGKVNNPKSLPLIKN